MSAIAVYTFQTCRIKICKEKDRIEKQRKKEMNVHCVVIVNRVNDGICYLCGFYLCCVIQSIARDRMINCTVSSFCMLLTEINFLVYEQNIVPSFEIKY